MIQALGANIEARPLVSSSARDGGREMYVRANGNGDFTITHVLWIPGFDRGRQ